MLSSNIQLSILNKYEPLLWPIHAQQSPVPTAGVRQKQDTVTGMSAEAKAMSYEV